MVLLFLMGLVALVVGCVVGGAIYWQSQQVQVQRTATAVVDAPLAPDSPLAIVAQAVGTGPKVAEVTETVTVTIPAGAGIRVQGGVVNFYFARNSADIAPGAAEALAAVIQGVEAGRKAVVSGYHDTTGDAQVNDQLAKLRAETIRDVLTGLGVPADKLRLERPPVTVGSGNDAEARRVEVRLVD